MLGSRIGSENQEAPIKWFRWFRLFCQVFLGYEFCSHKCVLQLSNTYSSFFAFF
jgi:hypothetical protein